MAEFDEGQAQTVVAALANEDNWRGLTPGQRADLRAEINRGLTPGERAAVDAAVWGRGGRRG